MRAVIAFVAIIAIVAIHADIVPTPETFTLPVPGIFDIGLSRNTTTLILATNGGQAYSVFTPYQGGAMKIIAKSDYYPGDLRCLLIGEDQWRVSILTSMPSNFSHPVYYLTYQFDQDGNYKLQSQQQFDVDSDMNTVCTRDTSQRDQQEGFYIFAQPGLFFIPVYTNNATLKRVGSLSGDGYLGSMTVIPGDASTHYEPPNFIASTDNTAGQPAPAYQYALPTPGAPVRTRQLAADEQGVQNVDLFGYNFQAKTQGGGWLVTELVKNGGIRLTPFDWSSYSVTGGSVVDPNTIRGDFPQKILVRRLYRCVYTVGLHPTSTQAKPIATLTQWYSQGPTDTPTQLAQVTFKLQTPSYRGIVGLEASWFHFVYVTDDQTIYRFNITCPDH